MTSAASPSGRCWTFDARADGYIKAEAVNCLILKRLDDAVRHGDPIRAVIRGTSTNSDGWTPGIASPSSSAQAAAILRAYERAGITALGDTAYLECHGTGTLAGDPVECSAASSVFAASRCPGSPLRIGSVKSNIGHSEPAAGISGMLKTVLAVERGIIPGNPTFEIPNPKIDFAACKLLASKTAAPWPRDTLRRASVNSFGYGGSNAHAIVEHPEILLPEFQATSVTSYAGESAYDDMFAADAEGDDDDAWRLLVFSANDDSSLKAHVNECIRHLSNPAVNVQSADLAYTLAERRSRHFFRAYAVSEGPLFRESQVAYGKPASSAPRVGFVFTGQGAQWPGMGRELLQRFPVARQTIHRLDRALSSMTDAPSWSLVAELCEPRSSEHMRLAEFSQPLVTALQLALLAVLQDWNLQPAMVVGHSSGEIAAAVAAGCISQEDGIKVAYLRGKAAKEWQLLYQGHKLGMLAVGLGSEEVGRYLQSFPTVTVACVNSPKSVTLAGEVPQLEAVHKDVQNDGHFARLLMVDLAYHSDYMKGVAELYADLLATHCPNLSYRRQSSDIHFYSTVEGALKMDHTDAEYWVQNMLSPVLFAQGVAALVKEGGADHLVELGPSSALAGPIKQITKGISTPVQYLAAFNRGDHAPRPLYDLAGNMFCWGLDVDLIKVNGLSSLRAPKPRVIIDLPNYQWNHSVKYWHESLASKSWRYRLFPVHDLLGTKVLGTSWKAPSWRRTLRLKDVPWIRDHMVGTDVVFPAAAYIAMAVEAMFQTAKGAGMELAASIDSVSEASYQLRDIRFQRALVIEEDVQHQLYLFLHPAQGQNDTWFHFRISSLREDAWTEHCSGLVRVRRVKTSDHPVETGHLDPLRYPSPAKLWYKSMQNVGFNFGTAFQNLVEIESFAGQRTSRASINFADINAQHAGASRYAVHPAIFDAFFQAGIPSLFQGHRTMIDKALVPQLIDDIHVSPGVDASTSAFAMTKSSFATGRPDKTQNYTSEVAVFDETTGRRLAKIEGLHYVELDVPQTGQISNCDMTPMGMSWKPDISLLPDDADVDTLAESDHEALAFCTAFHLPPAAAYLMSLLHHKVAVPSVLDLDVAIDTTWDTSEAVVDVMMPEQPLPTFGRYVYTTTASDRVTGAQNKLSAIPSLPAECYVYDPTQATGQPPFDSDNKFHFIVLRMAPATDSDLWTALRAARDLCASDGHVALVQYSSSPLIEVNGGSQPKEKGVDDVTGCRRGSTELELMLRLTAFRLGAKSTPESGPRVYHLVPMTPGTKDLAGGGAQKFPIVRMTRGPTSSDCSAFLSSLRLCGWTGQPMSLADSAAAFHNHDPDYHSEQQLTSLPPLSHAPPILLLDDPQTPFLASVTDPADWEHLRRVLRGASRGGRRLLWVSPPSASGDTITNPSTALVLGFARTLRGEDPTLRLATLNHHHDHHYHLSSPAAGPPSGPGAATSCHATARSALRLLAALDAGGQEAEFRAHGDSGLLCISRVVPDRVLVDDAAKEGVGAGEVREERLRDNPRTVRAWCERVGDMGSIQFNEVVAAEGDEGDEVGLGEGEVEVEVRAAGLNFKVNR